MSYLCIHFSPCTKRVLKQFVLAGVCMVLLGFFLCPAVSFASDAISTSVVQKGRASWYTESSKLKKTANGERFSSNSFSAAHKSLPFGTVVRVYNTKNGRQTLVRINDRGPFKHGRIVDVSKRAAKNLNMVGAGVVPVAVEVVSDSSGKPLNKNNGFFVRLGVADSLAKAESKLTRLENKTEHLVRILYATHQRQNKYNLCIGPFLTFKEAERAAKDVKDVAVKDIVESPIQSSFLAHFSVPAPGDNRQKAKALPTGTVVGSNEAGQHKEGS